MKFLKGFLIFLILLILSAASCIFYAFKIEPFRVKVNEYTLNERQPSTQDIKIVQISDLHIKEDFTYENLDKIIDSINQLSPDFVIFTGDLYDNYAWFHEDGNIITQLQKITANYAKIAIWGNRDYGGGAVRQYQSIMEQAGFTLLKNENWQVTLENNKTLLFTGLDDSLLGDPHMPDPTKPSASDYRILLTHEPDVVNNYLDDDENLILSDYDLVLSGHSHGGQINIPFLPAIHETAVSVTGLAAYYTAGKYTLDTKTQTKLYVNTGIGTTHISARFGVVPEIALFHIFL